MPAQSAALIERLAMNVARSESIRAVKRLQIAQAHLLLYGLWDEAADLYSREAEIASGDKVARGRETIRAWLIETFGYGQPAPSAKALRLQLILAPIVTLSSDGNSAKGRWSEIAATGIYGDRAAWFGGIQENIYIREDGVWKIHRIGDFPHFAGTYDDGWRSLTPHLPVIPYHFVPSMAGRPIPAIPGGSESPAANNPAQEAALLTDCETRIAALGDEDQIRNLQNAYGYYVDRKMWDDAADLFADEASFEIAGIGAWRRAQGVRRALELDGPGPLAMGQVNERLQVHMIVTVSPGGQARARGLQFGFISPRLGEAYWDVATFENTYAKGADGKWRLAGVHLFPVMRSDYYQGWAKNWTAPNSPPQAAAPDTRAKFASEPEIPAFSYLHPVTGKPIAGAAPSIAAHNGDATPAGSVDQRIDAASLALERSRAWDAIENISSALNNYLDDFQWDAYADLMAVDAWKPRADGFYIGRDHIYRSIAQAYMAGPSPTMVRDTIRDHIRTQPVIMVSDDAQTAKIRTRLLLFTINDQEPGHFSSGMYPNDMAVLEQGIWKFQVGGAINEKYFESISWKEGWARPRGNGLPKTNLPATTSGKGPAIDFVGEGGTSLASRLGNPIDFPPDVPSALMPKRLAGFVGGSPVWPQIKPMWFAYPNPVSGRLPEFYCPDLRTFETDATATGAKT